MATNLEKFVNEELANSADYKNLSVVDVNGDLNVYDGNSYIGTFDVVRTEFAGKISNAQASYLWDAWSNFCKQL